MASPPVTCEGDDDLAMCSSAGTPALVDALVWALVNHLSPYDDIDALLRAGADVNAADEAGTTPLHLAAASGDLSLLRYLVAVPNISLQPQLATHEQQTPRQLAEACGMAAAAQYLAEQEELAGLSGQGGGRPA
jgi:ankyrin repeat protein